MRIMREEDMKNACIVTIAKHGEGHWRYQLVKLLGFHQWRPTSWSENNNDTEPVGTRPILTCHVEVVDDHGVPVNMPNQAERSSIIISSGSCDDHVNHASRSSDIHQAGSLLVKLPLPPGTFPTLWKNDAGWGHCHSIFETYLSRCGHLFDSSSGSIYWRKP